MERFQEHINLTLRKDAHFMRQEDWNAKDFLVSLIAGEGNIHEMLEDLSIDQLAAVEVALDERLATCRKGTGPFQERMQRETVQ